MLIRRNPVSGLGQAPVLLGALMLGCLFSTTALSQDSDQNPDSSSSTEQSSTGSISAVNNFTEPTFTLSGIVIDGPELIPRSSMNGILNGFIGRPLTFSELRTATLAVEKLHAFAGFEVVKVIIPEQDVRDGGQLRMQIVDARLSKVLVDGNEKIADEVLVGGLAALVADEPINTRAMDRNLRLLNENPGVSARVTLEPSFEPQKVDAILKVTELDINPVYVTLDNTGNESTGKFRLGVVAQNNNMFGMGHQAYGQVLSSPGHWSDVKVFGLGYKIPLPAWDTQFEMSYSNSNVDAGTIALGTGTLFVQGSGAQLAFKATTFLDRVAGYDTRVEAGYELKRFDSEVLLNNAGPSLVPDVSARPVGLGFQMKSTEAILQEGYRLAYYKNFETGGNNSQERYLQVNPMSRVNYELIRGSANVSDQVFGGWRLNFGFDFQYTKDSLVSGEQFGAGGVYSVRGFDERALSADSGYRVSFELVTGNYGSLVKNIFSSLNFVIFAEAAALRSTFAPAGLPSEPFIASYGTGVRATISAAQQLRLDLGKVISGLPTQPHGDMMLHFGYAAAL